MSTSFDDSHDMESPGYVAATVRMHSGAVFSSMDASRMRTVIKNNSHQQIMVLCIPLLLQIRQPDTCESAFRDTLAN